MPQDASQQAKSLLPRKPSLFNRKKSQQKIQHADQRDDDQQDDDRQDDDQQDSPGAPRPGAPISRSRSTTPIPSPAESAPAPQLTLSAAPAPGHQRRRLRKETSTGSSAGSRHSFAASVSDFGSLRRSVSLRSSTAGISAPPALAKSLSPDLQLSARQGSFASTNASSPRLPASSTSSSSSLSLSSFRPRQKSHDTTRTALEASPLTNPAHNTMATSAMSWGRPSIAQQGGQNPQPSAAAPAAPAVPPSASGTNPTAIFQSIHDMASKRISTLDYLRKAHDGRVYWFNTTLFTRPDLAKMPSFNSRALSRRATNYLLLGFSLPAVLDLNAQNATEFLRTLNALLLEFETYQSIHPPDGSASSLSRGRVAGMFKRATHAATGITTSARSGRRGSSATTELGFPDPADAVSTTSLPGSSGVPSSTTGSGEHADHLLPGEEYALLLTPALPFDPDFFETFSTLCDVLIDVYTRIMTLVSGPEVCGAGSSVSELFAKADTRVRKLLIQNVVRDFEVGSREAAKSEVAGVAKVVLGGLL